MTTTPEITPDVAAAVAEAVRPWRVKVREAEDRLSAIREALIERFRDNNIDELQSRRQLNNFLSNYGLQTVPRTITGSVEVIVRQTFYFEDLELEDDADVDDAVTEWLKDEGHFDEYQWDLDSMDVSVDEDE